MSVFSAQELRDKFLKYFQSKNHQIIASASLIPDNDPTVLFITAGMQPLVPYLLGEKHPAGTRLVSIQKCLRTSDIDEVGDNTHHTFFEMLGNWSLGDYFKKEAIEWTNEFLTSKEYLAIPKEKLWVTVFRGNDVVEKDLESIKIWKSVGFSEDKIIPLSEKDNWWALGENGLCGPDTEIFIDTSEKACGPNCGPGLCECSRFVEVWNNVFMCYNKQAGKITELKQKNIDTGMGFERTLAMLNGFDDNYLTDLFLPTINQLEKLTTKKYDGDKRSFRIVADHIRSAVFILGDNNGVAPANKDQGYVLRRLIRRAIRFAKIIGIANDFTKVLAEIIIKQYGVDYPELNNNQDFIIKEIEQEENKFRATLEKGLKEFAKQKTIDGKVAFTLFSTYGFPLEMTEELAKENNLQINKEQFEAEFKKHQDLSRTASAGMFKGGLADDKQNTKRHHTAAHLMLQALRMTLGNHIEQRGSNINEDRLRFDFTHPEKMTADQIQKIEDIVNEQINKKMPVSYQEMTLQQAKEYGALGVFEHKYGDLVKVYTMGDPSTGSGQVFSKEICGGPHVDNTSELGNFKIIKEESSSAGVRRIKAQVK